MTDMTDGIDDSAGKELMDFARTYALRNLRAAREAGIYNGVVPAAQEVFELALRAGTRAVGLNLPESDDPAVGFLAAAAVSGAPLPPEESRALLADSKWLAENRSPAFYFERAYTEKEAARAADAAERAFAMVNQRIFEADAEAR